MSVQTPKDRRAATASRRELSSEVAVILQVKGWWMGRSLSGTMMKHSFVIKASISSSAHERNGQAQSSQERMLVQLCGS